MIEVLIRKGGVMVTLGVILLVVGLVLDVGVLWTLGLILVVVGLVFWVLGAAGRTVGGRRHWY